MAKKRNNNRRPKRSNQSTNGASRQPSKRLTKKLQYTSTVTLNNATSEYSYYSAYLKPDITAAVGALNQFAAYELWRLKKLRVYIQMANNSSTSSGSRPIDYATSSTVWTAADWGANENVSGVTIMQYQNAKKNTVNLNKWTKIIDTTCRINSKLQGDTTSSFIMPQSTWVNTTEFDSSFYSGYQLFIQSFGTQNKDLVYQPSFTVITEMDVEFLQPAFQNQPSTFVARAFAIKMQVQPDPNSPDLRTYIFDKITVNKDSNDNRIMNIRLTRQDGEPGSLTYTAQQLREAIQSGTSGIYFGGRHMIYDGPYPTIELPNVDFQITTEMT